MTIRREAQRLQQKDSVALGGGYLDDRLGSEARNRGRAVVIDAQGESAQSGRDPVALNPEGSRPFSVVRHNHQYVVHRLLLIAARNWSAGPRWQKLQ
jgi:hypothetical protein